MTKEEIEKQAEIQEFYHEPSIVAFEHGANYVNEKQPYTAQDMESFAEWCADSLYEHIAGNRWKSYDLNRIATTTQLRELWEKERRAK